MHKKIRVGVLFGGRSAEHEVSVKSARNVIAAIDPEVYEVTEIFIPQEGKIEDLFLSIRSQDVIFPVLHGTYGEDGTIQGLLKLADIPFVGAGVLGSAVGMDKDVMKRLLRDAGLPIAKFLVCKEKSIDYENIVTELGLPFFVKPANLGSSVGVSKVHDKEEFSTALNTALQYDNKIIIEEFIKGREIECAVLGNEIKKASIPGELVISHEFYDYDAKYIDPNGAQVKIPANLSEEMMKKVQELAIKTCDVLCCDGMARVDFFVTDDNEIYINEINTIPGFTDISMYPKMWEASGMSQTILVDQLLSLAIEKYKSENKIKRVRV